MRVHELAKKLSMSNRELIDKLKAGGMKVKTHSSGVDEAAAMKLLGTTVKPAVAEEKAAVSAAPKRRPRTMVRRRRDEPEPEAEVAAAPEPEAAPPTPEPAAEAAAAVVVSTPTAEAATVVSTPAEAPAAAPVEAAAVAAPEAAPVAAEAAAAAAPAAAAAAAEPAQVDAATPKAADAEAPKAAAADAPAATAEAAPKDANEPKPSNVVRVIDADAIKDRLRAEGRSFAPKPRRTFSRVREIRVVNDRFGGAPQMVDVTGQQNRGGPGGAGPGAGAGARKSGSTHRKDNNYRDRREARGRDMWVNPGRKKRGGKKGKGTEITQAAAHKRVVEIADVISVGDLSHKMAVKAGQVIAKLMQMGMMVTVNQTLDFETAEIVAQEFSFEVKNVAFEETDLLDTIPGEETEVVKGEPRAPVVTVMGHVDHGKTSLLDRIRKANVVDGEAGGITQHIGAYSVSTKKGDVTFLDTPGHAAFTHMRARGAQVTDVIILVVAADDGVMPQTREAIDHARAAGVPMVVAINKCDKPDAKPERVMQELTEYQLVPEEWGGDTQMVPVSALKGDGVDTLLESVAIQAEILELSADREATAKGTVIEAQLDKGRGPVATVLITQGTLEAGAWMVAGEHFGRVRAMYDSSGKKLKLAGPSVPVQVLGLSGVPGAGDRFDAVDDDKTAKQVAEHRGLKIRDERRKKDNRVSLEDFLTRKKGDDAIQQLNLVVKADVGGTMEALRQALENLSTKKVRVNIVRSGVGTITENDINLAVAGGAIVIGFNTKPDNKANAVAQHERVDVRTYRVIYECIDDVRDAMAGMLSPTLEERYVGRAEVRALFKVPKLGTIAGSMVTDGKIIRSGKIRVKRGDEVLYEGELASLKRFKDDAKDVAKGFECGIGVQGFNKLEEGDTLECFEVEEVKAELDEALVDIEKKAQKQAKAASEAGAPA